MEKPEKTLRKPARGTKIEWATHTVNWLAGCTKISPACTNCYAEVMTARLATMPNAPARYREGVVSDRRWTGRIAYDVNALHQAFADLESSRDPRRVFINSMSDTFHEDAPPESLEELALAIDLHDQCWFRSDTGCERLDAVGYDISTMEMPTRGRRSCIMLLTKRPDRLLAWQREHFPDGLPSWVWVGCTVEDQRRADERLDHLLNVHARVHFASVEPLLGPLDLEEWMPGPRADGTDNFRGLSWLIVGGESGPGARPMHPDWARLLRNQCAAAGVPFLFKQWGEWRPGVGWPLGASGFGTDRGVSRGDDGTSQIFSDRRFYESAVVPMFRPGKHTAGRLLDGRTWDEFPGEVRGA